MLKSIGLIGLGGWSGSGKDTVADYLSFKYGYTKHGFSVALKNEVAQRFRRTLTVEAERVYGDQLRDGRATLDDTIHRLLWNRRTPLTRAMLQEFGTEVRRADDPDYWIRKLDLAWAQSPDHHLVIPDVRFPNEFQFVKERGGCLFWVERLGIEPQSSHMSEQSLDRMAKWDAVILNHGSVEELYAATERAYRTVH